MTIEFSNEIITIYVTKIIRVKSKIKMKKKKKCVTATAWMYIEAYKHHYSHGSISNGPLLIYVCKQNEKGMSNNIKQNRSCGKGYLFSFFLSFFFFFLCVCNNWTSKSIELASIWKTSILKDLNGDLGLYRLLQTTKS